MKGWRWLAAAGLLVGCARPATGPGFLPPPEPGALQIEADDSVWLDPPKDRLPELPSDGRTPAIRITAVPARRGDDPAVAVLGRLRLRPDQLTRYDRQPLYATVLGAVDVETAEVYVATVQSGGGWSPDLDAAPPSGDAVSYTSEFGVDLRRRLRLPARRATYDVFAWFDDQTDGPYRVEVPASGQASMTPGRTVVADAVEPVEGDAVEPGLHSLEGTRVRGELPGAGVLIAFAVPSGRLGIATVPAAFALDIRRVFTRPPLDGWAWVVALADGRLTVPVRVALGPR